MSSHRTLFAAGVTILGLSSAAPAQTMLGPDERLSLPGFNLYGMTGAIDTPTAGAQPSGEIALSVGSFAGITRTTLSFQPFSRVQAAFRYTGYGDLNYVGFEDYYDRSFDVSLQLLRESRYLPAFKIGLQDIAGTGVSSGEYMVATKHFLGGRLGVSAGLGWGRLGSDGDIGSPFGDRPSIDVGEGGEFNASTFFRGPAAPFASVSFAATDQLTLLAEYGSDAYTLETGTRRSDAILDRESSMNYALRYRFNDALSMDASYMYGSTFGLRFTLQGNPYRPPVPGSIGPAPQPVVARAPRAADPERYTDDWVSVEGEVSLTERLAETLAEEGLTLVSLDVISADRVRVQVRNPRYDNEAQAIGRIARAMTARMPSSVEFFEIVPDADGLEAAAVTIRRTDLEKLAAAPNRSARLLAVTGIGEAVPYMGSPTRAPDMFPRLDYGLGPYARRLFFDPDQPFQLELGLRAGASYEAAPGLIFSGSISQPLVGDLGETDYVTNSLLEPVRTNQPLYDAAEGPRLDRLTGVYYFRPGEALYGRVTAGYLERMFGGLSTELLWKPVNSRIGLGAEVNLVRQRDFEGLGFQDYQTATGHVSAYVDLFGDLTAQLDVGRYLAGDVGATLSVSREFRNGWEVGAFATVTDATAEEFGEGSFDKGITLSIPVAWLTGQPTRRSYGTTLRPVTRDGGARLNVDGRLYDRVEDWHTGSLSEQWGQAWR